MSFDFLSVAIGGGLVILARVFFAAVVRNSATKMATTLFGIKLFHYLTPFLRSPTFTGEWELKWYLQDSKNFYSENSSTVKFYKIFNNLAAVCSFPTKSGDKREIEYRFVGKLSNGGTIATGLWVDNTGDKTGYHGSYQIVFSRTNNRGEGAWIGFDSSNRVKNGQLKMIKKA